MLIKLGSFYLSFLQSAIGVFQLVFKSGVVVLFSKLCFRVGGGIVLL